MKKTTILITGVGGNLGRSMVCYLNKFGFNLIVADINPEFLAAAKSSKRYLIPKAEDPKWLATINRIIQKEKVDIVVFQTDIEIRKASELYNNIKAKIWLPPYETIVKMQDKYLCNKIWQKNKISIPWSKIIYKPDQLRGQVWLRPLHHIGGGGAKALYAKDKKSAVSWIKKYKGWGNFTMNEYLPGKVFGFDSIWKKGKLIGWAIKERISFSKHEDEKTSAASTNAVRTSLRKDVKDIAIKSILAIDASPDGLFSVDLKENKKSVPCPTEINPGRFLTTSLLLFKETNYDLPLDYINLILGREAKKRKPLSEEQYLFYVPGLTRLLRKGETKIESI